MSVPSEKYSPRRGRMYFISIYKLGDVGISSNLIGSLSLTNGHCPEVDNETTAGVNSVLPKEPRNDILRTQNITIPNGTKKATNLGMKGSREKQCFKTQFAHTSSVFCPDRQVLLMLLSLSNNCSSTAPFQSPIQVNSSSMSVAFSLENDCGFLHSNSKHMTSFPEETS